MMMKVTATTSSVAAAEPNSWPQKFLHFTNRDNNLLLLSLLSLRAYWYPSMRKWRIMIYLLLSVVCVLCCVWACSSTRCNHNLCRDACERFIFIYVMWILFFFVPFYDIIFCCVWDIKKSLYFFFLVCTRWRAHRAYLHLSYIYISNAIELSNEPFLGTHRMLHERHEVVSINCHNVSRHMCLVAQPMYQWYLSTRQQESRAIVGKQREECRFFFCIIVPLKLNGNFRLPHVMTDNNCCECTMYVDYVVMCAVYVR